MEAERDAAVERARSAAAEAEECRLNGARAMEIASELAAERATVADLKASIASLQAAQTELRMEAAAAKESHAAVAATLKVSAAEATADRSKWETLLQQSRARIVELERQVEASASETAAAGRRADQLRLEHTEATGVADGLRARLAALEQDRAAAAAEDEAIEARRKEIVDTAKARAAELQGAVTALEGSLSAEKRRAAAAELAVQEHELAMDAKSAELAKVSSALEALKETTQGKVAALVKWEALGYADPAAVQAAVAAGGAEAATLRSELEALKAANTEVGLACTLHFLDHNFCAHPSSLNLPHNHVVNLNCPCA